MILLSQVPQLATYLLISLFPQLPFIIYLGYVQPVRFPVDPVLASFMIAFLVSIFLYFFINDRQDHFYNFCFNLFLFR